MSAGITRLRPRGVEPVSLWELPCGDALLWERIGAGAIEAKRRDGVAPEEICRALFADLCRALDGAGLRPDALFFSGGLTLLEGFDALLPAGARVSPGRRHPVAAAARHLGGRVLQADLGQTSLKLLGARGEGLLERPAALPLHLIGSPRLDEATRERERETLCRFLAGALREHRTDEDAVLLGLPCPVDDSLALGPCTYGFEHETKLLPKLAAALPEGVRRLYVCNDAELAALAAAASEPANEEGRVLCVTLGFGPGGAWLSSP